MTIAESTKPPTTTAAAPSRPTLTAVPEASAIRVEALTKTYKDGTAGLRGIDLDVRRGEVLCLLGPNGAGKTTLARILGTQLTPSSGRVEVFGCDLQGDLKAVRRRLAMVPQQSSPDYQLKVWEHIFYYLVARGQPWRRARRNCDEIIDQLGLDEKRDKLISQLSGGMGRRVLLCMALAADADLLLLDEPTAGLDVLLRRDVWDRLVASKGKRTVLLTTHSMEEAEALADRVGILSDGLLIAIGTVAELRRLAPGSHKVVLEEGSLPRELLEERGLVKEFAGRWAVFPREKEGLESLLRLAVDRGVEASVLHASLEDVFVHLVGDRHRKIEMGALR